MFLCRNLFGSEYSCVTGTRRVRDSGPGFHSYRVGVGIHSNDTSPTQETRASYTLGAKTNNTVFAYSPSSTYKARSLQRRSGGAKHARAHVIVDDARTLRVGHHLDGEFLQRRAGLAGRERRDAPSDDRALPARVRAACKTRQNKTKRTINKSVCVPLF